MRRKLPLALINRNLSVKLFLAVTTVIGLLMLAFALMDTPYETKILISLFLCLSAGLCCCLYFLVLRPVRRLTELTNHLDQGNYDRPVSVGSEDELGQLGENLNELNRKLKARTADLLKKRAD